MKRVLTVIMALVMLLSFAACGGRGGKATATPAPSAEDKPLSAEYAEMLKSGRFEYSFSGADAKGVERIVTVAKDGEKEAVMEKRQDGGYKAVFIGDEGQATDLGTGQVKDFKRADSGDMLADYSALTFTEAKTEGEKITESYSCTMKGNPAVLAFVFEGGKLTGIDSPESSSTDVCPIVEFKGEPSAKLFAIADNDAQLKEAVAFYKAKEYDKAFSIFTELAKAGNAPAMSYLGSCYENGYGVKENAETAVIWYKAGVDQGDAGAQACPGLCYERGNGGLEKDADKAIELYQLSADQGNELGQFYLGCAYGYDGIAEDDYGKALELYHASAEQGNDRAMGSIGYCYEYGIGVEQDYKQAAEWYQKSADCGNEVGQYCLGLLYLSGNGVTKDKAKAKELFELSAAQGYEDAIKTLKENY